MRDFAWSGRYAACNWTRAMRGLCFVLLVLAACDEEDDFCDPNKHVLDIQPLDTDSGDFIDNYDYSNAWALQATAVDGVQRVSAGSYDDCGTRLPTSAVAVTADAPAVLTATAVGPEDVELHAYQAGSASVSFVNDAGLHAHLAFEVKPLDHIRLVSPELGAPTAFYRGAPFARIMLLAADGKPVVDDSLEVSGDLARGERWNELAIAGAAAGNHNVTIIAGGSGWPMTVKVVDSIDSIVPVAGLTSYDACFQARLGNDVVGGVHWQIGVDRGYFYTGYEANCISVYGEDPGSPPVTVTASALGKSATVTITFPPA